MINNTPRVRFAPSPTGYLHVGGLRTALYNYLFAKNKGGKFILRIEDTDQNRFVEGAAEQLVETLNWIGLNYDEGPNKEGEYGPYFQSKRLDIYKKYSNQLMDEGKAYKCFCTAERLKELREEQQKQKLPQAKYDKHCLNLSPEEIDANIKAGKSYVVRLNVKPGDKVKFSDVVRKDVEFDRETIDDQILIKSDGFPTYHLANVVDDHLMKITHVIRGEEWLSSTPKHVLLYEYLGWELPVFAHLPLLLNENKSKLSKRQGDVAVEDYKDKGYLQEALINFVALLGWSAGDNVEFYKSEDLINKFSLERVQKSGAVFNVEKLNWLNGEHIRSKPNQDILEMLKNELADSKFANKDFSDDFLIKVIEAMKERISFVSDFLTRSNYFFEEPQSYDEKVVAKRWKPDSYEHMKKLAEEFETLKNPTKDDFEAALRKAAEDIGVGAGKMIHPVRLAVSGIGVGPGVFDLLYILGKEKVISRINTAINKIKID
ncbi:MAG: glutamate--tRNA ligase [Ignavibacteriae bacterium]|nr:glutamate--tRNA ligase [Ignavibacteriota bacterium]NOG98736.1 glutamate--tRNA ligase [Ignavibacteriota bacterium]